MNKKILVIDDDQDILEPLTLILEEEKYKVLTAIKGEQTYKKIKDFRPDLILLDILMSGSDGRTICAKLKHDSKTKDIPVILMSAHPGAEQDAVKCGANDFISKPFDTQDLLNSIAKQLKA
jgi:DNA-binding response OmpR family regulator